MNNFELRDTDMNEEIVAKTIYRNQTRIFWEEMVEVSPEIIEEMNDFLEKYSNFTGIKKTTFYRIDAYFNEEKLYILDINASFVDGWWNSLNFSRATSQEIDAILNETMPDNFYLQDEVYRPEFDLCRDELQILWIDTQEVKQLSEQSKTYVYGVISRTINVFPYDGMRMDNKMNLAMFSKIWESKNIEIPQIITPSEASWEDMPKDYVYKITGKNDIATNGVWQLAWWKVKVWKPKKWKWAASKWEDGKMLAQKQVDTMKNSKSENMQLIFMCADNKVISGYSQASQRDIINDNSAQSPIILNK